MSKTKAYLSPLFHRGAEFIKVNLPNTNTAKNTIRAVSGRKWSQTHCCWYVPKTSIVYAELKEKFEVIIENIPSSEKVVVPAVNEVSKMQPLPSITNIQPNFVEFKHQSGIVQKRVIGMRIILLPEKETRFKVFIPFDKKGWIAVVQEIPRRAWNMEESYWSVPYVKDSFRRIWVLGKGNISLNFDIRDDIPEEVNLPKKRTSGRKPKVQLTDVQKAARTALEERFILEGKAWKTIKTYLGLFRQFLLFHQEIKPSSISKEQIEQFLIYKKRDENASDSQMHQIINTLNAFYIRILSQNEKVSTLIRPKKKKRVPNIFSEEEILRLLKSCNNLKHKCILMLVYSGGLRKSEVLNLRPAELDFDRKTIFVNKGKGGKDRYTFFSVSAQKYLKEYLTQYRPKYYLFEGQTGGRYSDSSVQSIFQAARIKAKVKPHVTLHGLRHSFATHLVEKNVPLHVVQELLGHESIKTTEVYLHVSNKFRKELRSPLDDMDI